MTKTFNSQEAIKTIHDAKIFRMNSNLYYLLRNALDAFEVRGAGKTKIYYYQVTTGKWGKTDNYKLQVINALEILGIPYTEGNDAPRGGKTGDFILI
jgi:hypothetical protein